MKRDYIFDMAKIDFATVHYNDQYHKVMVFVRREEDDEEEDAQQLNTIPKTTFTVNWRGDHIPGQKLCQNCGYYFDEASHHSCGGLALDTKSVANALIHQYKLRDGCAMHINGEMIKRKRICPLPDQAQ